MIEVALRCRLLSIHRGGEIDRNSVPRDMGVARGVDGDRNGIVPAAATQERRVADREHRIDDERSARVVLSNPESNPVTFADDISARDLASTSVHLLVDDRFTQSYLAAARGS